MKNKIPMTKFETNAWRKTPHAILFVSIFEFRPSFFIRGFEVSFFEFEHTHPFYL
jgi:hypothetical protein